MKSLIRKEIESILNVEKGSRAFIDPTNKNKTKYRMKIVGPNILTKEKIRQIKNLSQNIISVSYAECKYRWSYHNGITIHFDCKPSKAIIYGII